MNFDDLFKNRNYTSVGCVGSRTLSPSDLYTCKMIGCMIVGHYRKKIVSGNGIGADQAYASGSPDPRMVELWLPWDGFEQHAIHAANKIYAMTEAEEFRLIREWADSGMVPFYGRLECMSPGVRKLFGRNIQIVGASDFIIAWPGKTRGTKSTMKYAELKGKPVIDISQKQIREELADYMDLYCK